MRLRLNNKYYLYPFLLLTIPIVIDTLTGIGRGNDGTGESKVGILFRGIVILLSIQYLYKYRYAKYTFSLLSILFFCLLFQIVIQLSSFSIISQTTKILFLYFNLAILLKSRYFKNTSYIADCAIYYGVGASIILLVCHFFNLGYTSYTDETFGTKGFFVAMNDVGLSIILLNGLSLMYYEKTKQLKYLLYSVIMFVGCAFVGSMACYGGSLILIILFIISLFYNFKDFKPSKKLKLTITSTLLLILFYAIGAIIIIIQEDAYLSSKYDDIFETLSQVSGRDFLIKAGVKVMNQFSLSDWIFGQGETFNVNIQHRLQMGAPKAIEVDQLDLLGNYGFFFSFLILIFPIIHLLKSIKLFFIYKSIDYYWICIGLIIFLGHSFYGGHAYTSPLVQTFLAVYIYLLLNLKQNNYK